MQITRGANFEMPTVLADSFTMCQTAFSVILSPHALPTLLTLRNSFPSSIAAATSQSFTSFRTPVGHWNRSDVTALT